MLGIRAACRAHGAPSDGARGDRVDAGKLPGRRRRPPAVNRLLNVFPALFTAGMSLMDTTDSVLMTGAYGWAFVKPVRKLWYNLTITAASVVVALFIGGVEVFGLIGDKFGLEGRFWSIIGGLNDNLAKFGFAVVGIFIASWIVSTVIYRANGLDNLQVMKT